jgi:eukaryotic-like serine/threonine-protein kinase
MTLALGSQFGPYDILAPLGAGGMGEVFRARDRRLGREVALKVLPAGFAEEPERVARFRREATLLASLNHPRIAAIHGLEEAGGVVALALELVEGEDLAERLQRGALPAEEAIAVARQIAEGLEAAHERGIVHRDLKPANVKLTRDDAVKILDFGLAKAVAGDAAGAPDDALSASPTLSRPMTEAGFILGTAAYMSPEQARGRAVDKRSDIWAFGVVLYEMLTGRRLFSGETITDVLAAVLRHDPDWAALPPDTPPGVRALLRRCLERDPRRRMRDIGEARIVLEGSADTVALDPASVADGAPSAAMPPTAARHGARLPWIVALASLLVAVAATALRLLPTPPTPAPITRLEMTLPEESDLYSGIGGTPLAFSPDGTTLAFITTESGVRRIHLRSLDSYDLRTVQAGVTPLAIFFSPDGSKLGVIGTDRVIKEVTLRDGATADRVRDVAYPGAASLPDGRLVFVHADTLWIAPAMEGEAKPLTTLDETKQELTHRWPSALPDGETVLFAVVSGPTRESRIEAVNVKTGARSLVEAHGTLPVYVEPGYLVFGRDDSLQASPFDPHAVRVTGPTTRIIERVSMSGMGTPIAAVSSHGQLAYLPYGAVQTVLTWVTPSGAETPFPVPPDSYTNPRLSPDGRRVAVGTPSGLWIADPERGTVTRLAPIGDFPLWSKDATTIFYRTESGLFRTASDGSGTPQPFPVEAQNEYPCDLTPDGRTLVTGRIGNTTGADIYVRPSDGRGESLKLIGTPAYEGGPSFSPDGRFLVYASDDSGRMEIYIRPYPGPDRRWQVSNEGGTHPRWSRDGRIVYYRHGEQMLGVDVTVRDGVPALSRPRRLFDDHYAFAGNLTIPNYDVAPDGSRLLMVRRLRGVTRLSIVLNWPEMLRPH